MYMLYGLQFPQNLWCSKNVFGEIQKYTYCKKWFLDNIKEMPPYGRRDLICHAIALHPLAVRNMCRQKYVKIWISRQIYPSQLADVYKNNQEVYISHASQLLTNELCWKICTQDIEHDIYYKNICWAFQWNAFLMGFICHAMSLHPGSMPRIAVVSNCMINNISQKQLKKDRWKECTKFM